MNSGKEVRDFPLDVFVGLGFALENGNPLKVYTRLRLDLLKKVIILLFGTKFYHTLYGKRV